MAAAYQTRREQRSDDVMKFANGTFTEHDLSVMSNFAKILLSLPPTSVEAERGFSVLGEVKTKRRNRLGEPHLNDCLIVNMSGPPPQEIDFMQYAIEWFRDERRLRGTFSMISEKQRA